MAKNRYYKTRGLTLVQQIYFMRLAYPGFSCVLLKNSATWIGLLQPTALGEVYKIRIAYTPPSQPKIKVLSPELQLHPDHTRLPHFYYDEGLLCLYAKDWNPSLPIAYRIMQWISGWLYFYEVWQFTGLWVGGGTHPSASQHRSA